MNKRTLKTWIKRTMKRDGLDVQGAVSLALMSYPEYEITIRECEIEIMSAEMLAAAGL